MRVLNAKEANQHGAWGHFPDIINDFKDSAANEKVFSNRAAAKKFIEKINYDFFSQKDAAPAGSETKTTEQKPQQPAVEKLAEKITTQQGPSLSEHDTTLILSDNQSHSNEETIEDQLKESISVGSKLSETELKAVSRILQRDIIEMVLKAGNGHPGGSLSMIDMITALYCGGLMRYDPKDPKWINRDRFVLSKGHAAPGLYAILGEMGFFNKKEEFPKFRQMGGKLQGHPDMVTTPGVEISAGSLGVAFTSAEGMAIAAKMDGLDYITFCMLGDGETQEGQVDETARHAAKMGLDNLIAFIDWNGMQIDGKVTNVDIGYDEQAALWQARGWNVIKVEDGHDVAAIVRAGITAKNMKNGKPTLILAKTHKGHDFEGFDSHGSVTKDEEQIIAARLTINNDLTKFGVEPSSVDNFIENINSKIRIDDAQKRLIDSENAKKANAIKEELLKIARAATPIAAYKSDATIATRTAGEDEQLSLGIEDIDAIAICADLKGSVMMNKFEKAFGTFSKDNPLGRYIGAGIREALMPSLAAGLATCGKVAIVGTFAVFTPRMKDQIKAILKAKLPLVVVGTHVGLSVEEDGDTHQDSDSAGIFAQMPNVKIYEAADAEEARLLYRLAYENAKRDGGVHYVRLARPNTPILAKPAGWQEGAKKGFYPIYVTTPEVAADVTIISSGVVSIDAINAAKKLGDKELSVQVLNVTQLRSIVSSQKNMDDFAKLIQNSRYVITVADQLPHILEDKINKVIVERGFGNIKKVIPLGIQNFGESGKRYKLYAKHGFDEKGIMNQVLWWTGQGAKLISEKGQSVWYDGALPDDKFASYQGQEVVGQTTNLTIINNAIKAGMFDKEIAQGLAEGKSIEQIYDYICISYIKGMAQRWKSVYDKTYGKDGYVSIELNPDLANDVEASVKEALRLRDAIDMSNLMIKVPATKAGMKIIEELTYNGINVNVTLLFSVEDTIEAGKAYERGMERRNAKNLPLNNIRSVLSVFVSRVNCKPGACDEQIKKLITQAAKDGNQELYEDLSSLLGKSAIANAVLTYDAIEKLFNSHKFNELKTKGANAQRLLWASTGAKSNETYSKPFNDRNNNDVKEKSYSPLIYIVNLPLKDTINTIPPDALDELIRTRNINPEQRNFMTAQDAQKIMDKLVAYGIDINKVTYALQNDGVESFKKDYADSLGFIKQYVSKLKGTKKTNEPSAAKLTEQQKTARLLAGTGLEKLTEAGQSTWIDGAFTKEQIDFYKTKGAKGQTTNLTIINNAIKAGMFDDKIREGIEKGKTPEQIYDDICVSYIKSMAQAWKSVYNETGGKDGYVSIEVNPDYAYDITKTVNEAKRLIDAIGMPNVMIKVPATAEGVKAIEELTYAGVSVNVTLLFGVDNCEEAFDAYQRGLQRRADENKDLDNIHLVLSFFVSRVNCKPGACDELLKKAIEKAKSDKDDKKVEFLSSLIGKAAIANTVLAYDVIAQKLLTKEWLDLSLGLKLGGMEEGANAPRLLWASTEIKSNEAYADGTKFSPLMYVINLPLKNTVNTMPKNTLENSIMAESIDPEERNNLTVPEAKMVMKNLLKYGIDIKMVTDTLQKDGVKSFAKDYADSLKFITDYVSNFKSTPELAKTAPDQSTDKKPRAGSEDEDAKFVRAITEFKIDIKEFAPSAEPIPTELTERDLGEILNFARQLHGLEFEQLDGRKIKQQETVRRIEIFLSQRVGISPKIGLSPKLESVIRRVNDAHKKIMKENGGKEEDIIVCRPLYGNAGDLKRMLDVPAEKGVIRVVIVDEEFKGADEAARNAEIEKYLEQFGDLSCFDKTRVVKVQLPDGYEDMPEDRKTFHEAQLVKMAEAIGLVDKDSSDPAKIMAAKMLEGYMEGKAEDQAKLAKEYIDNIAKEGWKTADRLKYFLGKTVSLLPKFLHEFELFKLRLATALVAA